MNIRMLSAIAAFFMLPGAAFAVSEDFILAFPAGVGAVNYITGNIVAEQQLAGIVSIFTVFVAVFVLVAIKRKLEER